MCVHIYIYRYTLFFSHLFFILATDQLMSILLIYKFSALRKRIVISNNYCNSDVLDPMSANRGILGWL